MNERKKKQNHWHIYKLCLLAVWLIAALLLCCGCWDKKELNQMAFAQAMAIDYQDSRYRVTVQLILPNAGAETISGDSLWNRVGEGNSVGEAMQKISLGAPRELYLDHLDLILLGEGVLTHHVGEALEYLYKENVLRGRTRLLAAEDAGRLLSESAKLAEMDIFYIDNLLEDQKRRARGNDATLYKYILATENGLKESVLLPYIVQENDTTLCLDGAVIIKNDRICCRVDTDWLSGYYWLMGGTAIMTLSEDGKQIMVSLEKQPCRWELCDTDTLSLRAVLRANITIVSGYRGWQDAEFAEDKIHSIQTQIEANARKQVESALRLAQNNGADAFGVGRWLYAHHQNKIDVTKWEQQFSAVPITLSVDTKVEMK